MRPDERGSVTRWIDDVKLREHAAFSSGAVDEDRTTTGERSDTALGSDDERGSYGPPSREGETVERGTRPDDIGDPNGRGLDDPVRLQLLGEVARGGMGAILRGRDHRLGRDLAIKVLLDSHEANPTTAQRFIEEAQITGQLQHPGIVPIYDLGVLADRRPYFAMKLVDGATLSVLLRERPNAAHDQVRFLAIFQHVAQTVAYAHSRGIIHRDLKPSNIMVGSFGEVLVMDWGLAKPLRAVGQAVGETLRDDRPRDPSASTVRNASRENLTEAGTVVGTPAYMAPEQARGEIECLDERCDVFALGSILCEILTGRPAYTGRSALEIRHRAAHADLSEARARLDGCGADADLILLARDCLAVAPSDRARDASVVAARLSAYMESLQDRIRRAEVGRAAEQARAEEARRTAAVAEARALAERRARRLTAALAASVLALMALGIGIFAWSARQRRDLLERVGAVITKAETQYLETMRDPASDPHAWQAVSAILDQAESLLHGTTDPGMSARLASLRDRARIDAEKADEAGKRADRLSEAADDLWNAQTRSYDRPEEAIRLIRAVLAIRPSDSQAYDNLGDALRGQKDLHGAVAAYREAIRLKPDSPVYRNDLANLLKEMGDLDGAIDAYGEAIRLRPDDSAYRGNLGDALRAKKDLDRAIDAYRNAIRLNPDDPRWHNNLGVALGEKGELDKAIDAYHEAIRLKPDDPVLRHNLGFVLQKKGDWAGAIDAYRHAFRLKPGEATYCDSLGDALLRWNDPAGAMDAYRQAVQLRPDSPVYRNDLGNALYALGDLDAAIENYREAVRLRPNDAVYRYTIGNALWAKGDLDGATDSFRQAVWLQPGDDAACSNLADVLWDKGDSDGAIAAYSEAIRLKPNSVAARSGLARALRGKGNLDRAIAAYREALRLKPDDAWSRMVASRLERLKLHEPRLSALLRGDEALPDAGDTIALALVAFARREFASSARLYTAAFARDPSLADDSTLPYRHAAAQTAALAGSLTNRDQTLDGASRATFRAQALGWLRADLGTWRRRLESDPQKSGPEVRSNMTRWKTDFNFAGVRQPDALAKLPEAERQDWQKFWADVSELLAPAAN